MRLHPKGIAADSDTFKAFQQSLVELFVPPSGNSLRIELIAWKIPFVTRKNLDLASDQMAIKIGNISPQEVSCLVRCCWRGDCPNTKFVAA